MLNLIGLKERIVEIAEELDWRVELSSNDEDDYEFEFYKCSSTGQDFSFFAYMIEHNLETLIDNIYERYNDYDCSTEAYLWLDNTGHGTNGAPYDMKEVYEDMEACKQMMLELYDRLYKEDWSKYLEEEE